jgi:prepilin-type N-terminal cleavage/methylation domain-containing protein
MGTLMSRPKAGRESGFTLMEVLIAISILAFGLLAVAALMSQMNVSTAQSRYMSNEALLASEKLEDLNRYPATDPNVAGGGSLTTDSPGYFDTIQISAGAVASSNGDLLETTTGTDSTGSPNYTIVKHQPDGTATSATASGSPPAATSDMLIFDRRWLIEQNVPVTGVRRITVLIILKTAVNGQHATFQTSMVRP